jgi:hypothetical protein
MRERESAAVEAVVLIVRTTSTCGLPAGTEEGEKVQLDRAGSPEQAKVIGELVAGMGMSVMCSVTD